MQHKKSFFSNKIRKSTESAKNGKYQQRTKRTKIRGQRGRKLIATSFKAKLTHKTSLYLYLVFGLGLVLAFVYFVFLTPTLRVSRIDLFEGEVESQNVAYKQVAAGLRGKNLLLLSNSTIIEKFLKANPRIKNMVINKDYPHNLKIVLSESPLAANLIVKNGKVEKKFIVNEQGIVSKFDEFSDKLPTIYMETDHFPVANEEFLTIDLLNNLLTAIDYFVEMLNIRVNQINYLLVAKEAHIITEKNTAIWLDLDKDYKHQIEKLKDVIPKVNLYEEEFAYVDLRISGVNSDKIIFKRR